MKNVAIIKLKGGMGNQMFQYAFGKALEHSASERGEELALKFDITAYDTAQGGDTFRKLLLTHLSTNITPATLLEINHSKNPFGPFSRIARAVRRMLTQEHHVDYHPELLNPPYKAYYEGYWQSEKYFTGIEDTLRHDFIFKTEPGDAARALLEQISADPNAVSIFYRRTDYVNHSELDIGEQDYQIRAIAKMLELVPNAHFYVMSDDIAWVRANAKLPADAVFVSSPAIKDYEEMLLMSACKHNVIPNSSFAWWGAWLNSNKDKHVIMPQYWTKDKMSTRHKDIAPNNWIRV